MRNLLHYLNDYKKESVLGPFFKFLEAAMELIVPFIMAKIIDVGIPAKDSAYILGMCGVLVGLGLAGFGFSLVAQYFAAKAALGFGTAVRSALYRTVNALSHKEIDNLGTSTMITRMTSDVNQAETGVNMFLRLFTRSPFIVVGALISALFVNLYLGLIFLATTLLVSLAVFLIMKNTLPRYKDIQGTVDEVSRSVRENLEGARVVRAFGRREREQSDFIDTTERLKTVQERAGKISALMNPLTYVVVNLAVVALLWFGGQLVNNNTLTQGEIVALINYMTQIILSLITAANLFVILTKSAASGARVAEVLALTPSLAEGHSTVQTDSEQPAVSFCDVSFSYGNSEKKALSHITFSVNYGQTIGIIGGTGAGKSTLMSLIPRFYDVTEGAVLVDGIDVKGYPFDLLRGKIGIVPQRAALLSGTIRSNLSWGREGATDEELLDALSLAAAQEFVLDKKEGLDAPVAKSGRNFSGGQRQRLTIARALVRAPKILILDDSSSALDYATDATLRKNLARLQNTAVFIVSQRAFSLRNADKIIVLDKGEAVGIGTHSQLLAGCAVYQEICRSQNPNGEVQA